MTNPELHDWPQRRTSYRRSEISALVGRGEATWERVAREILQWKVKTASGFTVNAAGAATAGERLVVTARPFGITIAEPVQVTAVVMQADRVGFAYRTLPGHPVSGEEAFIVHRQGEQVYLTIRSLTRAAPQQPWRALYPLLLVAQLIVRRRYLRALR